MTKARVSRIPNAAAAEIQYSCLPLVVAVHQGCWFLEENRCGPLNTQGRDRSGQSNSWPLEADLEDPEGEIQR